MTHTTKQIRKLITNFHYWQNHHPSFGDWIFFFCFMIGALIGFIVALCLIAFLEKSDASMFLLVAGSVTTCAFIWIITSSAPYFLIVKLPELVARKSGACNE